MAFSITYTRSGDSALNALETVEKEYIRQKLTEIALSEFRHPTEWDFERMDGSADGRFRIGDNLRVFAEIDEETAQVRVCDIRRRENCYS